MKEADQGVRMAYSEPCTRHRIIRLSAVIVAASKEEVDISEVHIIRQGGANEDTWNGSGIDPKTPFNTGGWE